MKKNKVICNTYFFKKKKERKREMRVKERTSKLIYQNPTTSLTHEDPNKALITRGLTLLSIVTMESSVNGK